MGNRRGDLVEVERLRDGEDQGRRHGQAVAQFSRGERHTGEKAQPTQQRHETVQDGEIAAGRHPQAGDRVVEQRLGKGGDVRGQVVPGEEAGIARLVIAEEQAKLLVQVGGVGQHPGLDEEDDPCVDAEGREGGLCDPTVVARQHRGVSSGLRGSRHEPGGPRPG
jgi:hypothetical protein